MEAGAAEEGNEYYATRRNAILIGRIFDETGAWILKKDRSGTFEGKI